MELLDLPNELLIHIISFADISTIGRLSRVCKELESCCSSKAVWKLKWKELVNKCPLDFSSLDDRFSPDENPYKSMYKRLWCVWFSKCTSEGCLRNFVSCLECKQLTCADNCSQSCHIAIDIGSSTSRIAAEMQDGSFNYSHHPTSIGLVRKTTSASETAKKLTEKEGIPIPRIKPGAHSYGMAQSMPGNFNSSTSNCVSSSLPNDYLRRKLNRLDIGQQHNDFDGDEPHHSDSLDLIGQLDNDQVKDEWQIVCLVCSILKKEYRKNRRSYRAHGAFNSCRCQCHHRNRRDKSHRRQWFCYESAFHNMFDKNCYSISPLEAVTKNNLLSCMEFHITHILKTYLPHLDLHRPNITAVYCEPWNATPQFRAKIAEIMYERIKVPRLLFVNKAIAASYLINSPTCIVIDSGSLNTVTSVVIDRQVSPNRVEHCNIGGYTVTEYILDNVDINYPNVHFDIASLDRMQIKNQCHIPYLLSLDEKRRQYECKVKLKSCCTQSFAYYDIGAAHYLAPELMYSALDLPRTIQRLTHGLGASQVCALLKHVIFIGGNTKLEGFAQRLTRDMREMFPTFRNSIKVQSSYHADRVDAIHGALRFSQSNPCSENGAVSREQYIIHGPQIFSNLASEQGASCTF